MPKNMSELGKIFIFFGLFLFVLGVIFTLDLKIPFIGKLPGDIFIRRDGFTFYFPLATSIILSIILTLILNFLSRK